MPKSNEAFSTMSLAYPMGSAFSQGQAMGTGAPENPTQYSEDPLAIMKGVMDDTKADDSAVVTILRGLGPHEWEVQGEGKNFTQYMMRYEPSMAAIVRKLGILPTSGEVFQQIADSFAGDTTTVGALKAAFQQAYQEQLGAYGF